MANKAAKHLMTDEVTIEKRVLDLHDCADEAHGGELQIPVAVLHQRYHLERDNSARVCVCVCVCVSA